MNLTVITAHWRIILFILFSLVTAIQAFYYLYYFRRLAFYKKKERSISQTHPVSVIICARDEAANLTVNLPGSLVQKYQTSHEVILVDDNSFDESKYIIEEFQKTFKQLHFVELKQEARFIPGKKFALSVGIKTAKYEIVLLTDADCVPASEHWIQHMQEGFGPETEIVLGYGGHHKKKGLLNKFVRWETFQTAKQYLSFALAGNPYMGVGRNLSYKKSVFFRHKGFSAHNHIASGDDDLFINMAANKNNTEVVIDKDAFTLSAAPKNWSQWIRQKNRHYSTGKYYKTHDKFLLGLYTISHFLFYPLMVAAAIFFSWKLSLLIYGLRLLIQGVIYYHSMKKLNELDLYPWFWILDVWMFFYYLLFSFSIFKKPSKSWK